jgi:DNA polymerase-1
LRANVAWRELPSGKQFGTVNLRENALTWTKTFHKTAVPGGAEVYCVTVDSGAVIVRRNGKISITGQSQQEPRILAHFEDGALQARYKANPWMDFHDDNREQMERHFHRPFKRKLVKNTGLGIIYGMGVASLAWRNGQSYEDAKQLRDAIYALYPGLKEIYADMRLRAANKQPFRTWGGREVYCEPPIIAKGRIIEWDYKMPNYAIQGSAADCTKEAVIRFYTAKQPGWFLILQVHDELVVSAPVRELAAAMDCLRRCMESVEFEVQILSEGEWSTENWAAMQVYDKKGKRVAVDLPRRRRAA